MVTMQVQTISAIQTYIVSVTLQMVCFNYMKANKMMAIRQDKLDVSIMAFIALAAIKVFKLPCLAVQQYQNSLIIDLYETLPKAQRIIAKGLFTDVAYFKYDDPPSTKTQPQALHLQLCLLRTFPFLRSCCLSKFYRLSIIITWHDGS